MVFGTDSPPNNPGMWLRELEVLCSPEPQGMNLSEDILEDYLATTLPALSASSQPSLRAIWLKPKSASRRLTSEAGVRGSSTPHLLFLAHRG
ncbi:hypothetical protein [Paracoccus methylarcula]|uniref:hypothetical protein n=1 Tax=Paracoccus methylarcula TaxID=72022 RepID=UPI00344C8C7C